MSIFDDIGKGFESVGKGLEEGLEVAGKETAGLFTGDTYFPDNPKRESRSRELSGDVSQISYRIAVDNQLIRDGLKNLNQTIESVYHDAGLSVPTLVKTQSINYHQTEYKISQFVAPLIALKTINYALTDSAVVGEAEAGEIGGEVAAEALGAAGLELGPAAVVMAGIAAAIGAIEGAEKRSELQESIHKLYKLRLKLKTTEITDMKLANALTGLSAAVVNLGKVGYSEQQLTGAIQTLISNAEKALELDVSSQASAQLTSLDKSRGSWTQEDS